MQAKLLCNADILCGYLGATLGLVGQRSPRVHHIIRHLPGTLGAGSGMLSLAVPTRWDKTASGSIRGVDGAQRCWFVPMPVLRMLLVPFVSDGRHRGGGIWAPRGRRIM